MTPLATTTTATTTGLCLEQRASSLSLPRRALRSGRRTASYGKAAGMVDRRTTRRLYAGGVLSIRRRRLNRPVTGPGDVAGSVERRSSGSSRVIGVRVMNMSSFFHWADNH